MSAPEAMLPLVAILAMAAATWLVRMAGYWIMGRVPLTPFVRACLDALPGTIVVATIVPLAARGGLSAWIGIAVAAGAMVLMKRDIAALAMGLGAVVAVRALGLP
ncbi:AzlD family protein [Phreatobacter sp.]|uniref:AzlD family protein n=1 Tax=Phreatobacter sp. TaxID=1966341 RepID=UPI003F6F83B9